MFDDLMTRLPPMARFVRQRRSGFTLIELLIVVAMIAILTMIALPSYTRYVMRSRRASGQDLLMTIATAQERYYTNFNKYASGPTGLGTLGFSTTASLTSEGGYYVVSLAAGSTATGFTLQAEPQGPQAADKCKNLTLTNTGSKDWTGDKPVTNGNCW